MTPRFNRQPATSQLRHQISIFTRPHQHTPPEKYQPRNRSCDECDYTTSSGNLSRQKFAIHQKRRHSCDCGKSIASKYDLSQHISRVHDNCPIIYEICSKPFNNRQRFANHKIIKHSSNSHKKSHCPACRTSLIATRFWVVVICPIIKCLTVLEFSFILFDLCLFIKILFWIMYLL